ncbi:uncharacterized protein DUF3592 [Prosthecobacter fusiformis]|uniref:Uncharacterized protein DUF3592 n=1 Tax=Prosthecobacter fusiformis TaxID=48464 RepID=A0A4R7RJ88_9BACT|nr:DUF3592 domain-containing protein [Prosthecobacter fusiformis]TDU64131.1 uncharacterized protein DUF3592 [Prosthecobacter fusiformis]
MSSRHTASGDTFLIPFGLIFLLAGLGVGYFYYDLLSRWYSARHWVQVPCIIESSALRDHMETRPASTTEHDTLMNEAMATYAYEYEGRPYQGTEVALSGGADNFGDYQQRVSQILDDHRTSGTPYRCFVNPDDPTQAVIFRDARWTLLLFISIFPLLFPLVGGITATMGLLGRSENKRVRGYQTKYPDQPWRWKSAWGPEWMPPKNAGRTWIWVTIATWMSILWLPMLYALVVDGDISLSSPISLLPFLTLVPILFVSRAALRRILEKRYGQILLHVEPRPITPGSTLNAWLAIPQNLPLGQHEHMQAQIRCIREVTTRSGKNTTVNREVLWSDHQSLPLAEATREARGSRLPVTFTLPAGLPAMPVALADVGWHDASQHLWELELTAPRLTRPMVYDLPVFQTDTASSSTPVTSTATSSPTTHPLDLDADELTLHLARHHITAVFDSRQLPVSFDLSPRRYATVRLFLICFTSFWSLAFLILLNTDAPGLFPLIWGVTSAMLWALIVMQLRRQRLQFSDTGVDITWSLGPWSGRRSYEKRHLVQFQHRINMTSGATAYHVVSAETIFGKKVTLIDGIPSSLVVENLCRLLEAWRKQA